MIPLWLPFVSWFIVVIFFIDAAVIHWLSKKYPRRKGLKQTREVKTWH